MSRFLKAGNHNKPTIKIKLGLKCGVIRELCKGEWMKAFPQAGNLYRVFYGGGGPS